MSIQDHFEEQQRQYEAYRDANAIQLHLPETEEQVAAEIAERLLYPSEFAWPDCEQIRITTFEEGGYLTSDTGFMMDIGEHRFQVVVKYAGGSQ